MCTREPWPTRPASRKQNWSKKYQWHFRGDQGSTSFWAATGKERGWKMPDPEEEEKDKTGSFRFKFSGKPTPVNRTELFFCKTAAVAWSLSLCFTVAEMDGSIRTSRAMQCVGQLFLLHSGVYMRFWRYPCWDAPWTALLKVRMRMCKGRVTDVYKLGWIKSSALIFL